MRGAGGGHLSQHFFIIWIGMGIGLWYGFGSVVPLAISAQRIPPLFLFPDCGFENYGRF